MKEGLNGGGGGMVALGAWRLKIWLFDSWRLNFRLFDVDSKYIGMVVIERNWITLFVHATEATVFMMN